MDGSCVISKNRGMVALLWILFAIRSNLCGGQAEAASMTDSDAEIYSKFRAYRLALTLSAAGDSTVSVSDYFSNKIIRSFVEAALHQHQNEDLGNTLLLLRGRFKSAGEVNVVYRFSVVRNSESSAKLTLVFRGISAPEPRTETIMYVFENNDWRINGVTYYGFKGSSKDDKALETSKEVTNPIDTFGE